MTPQTLSAACRQAQADAGTPYATLLLRVPAGHVHDGIAYLDGPKQGPRGLLTVVRDGQAAAYFRADAVLRHLQRPGLAEG